MVGALEKGAGPRREPFRKARARGGTPPRSPPADATPNPPAARSTRSPHAPKLAPRAVAQTHSLRITLRSVIESKARPVPLARAFAAPGPQRAKSLRAASLLAQHPSRPSRTGRLA